MRYKWREPMLLISYRIARFFADKELVKNTFIRRTWVFWYSHLARNVEPVWLPDLGVKMLIDPANSSSLQMLQGKFDPLSADLLIRIVREGMVVVDLGAHIGYCTLIAAKAVGEKGKVFAFEPEPNNYASLLRNIQVNEFKNIVPVPKAVSNYNGVAELFVPPYSRLVSRMYAREKGWESIPIETTTLDSFFSDKDCRIDLIKIDIEGAEVTALEGMANILEKNQSLRIITEFYPNLLRMAGSSPEGYLGKLMEYGFKLYHINEQGKTLAPVFSVNDVMKMFEGKKAMLCINLFGER